MLATDVIQQLLGHQSLLPKKQFGEAFAPSNIALVKYWGKRHDRLHLPMNSSVSISLGDKGATTRLSIVDDHQHHLILNGQFIPSDHPFYQRLQHYLDLYQVVLPYHFKIETQSDVPIAAGVASSACGFAALVLALADLFAFGLDKTQLSILARLGSGSASRSLWPGFVCWHHGRQEDGSDCVASPLPVQWPDFCIGLWCFDNSEKAVSSRAGMAHTMATSPAYEAWPARAEEDFKTMCQLIEQQDFEAVGELAESNALAMHATMHAAHPPVNYWQTVSKEAMQQVWQARELGLAVYFTMDAGPNLKLLGSRQDLDRLQAAFPAVEWIFPFALS